MSAVWIFRATLARRIGVGDGFVEKKTVEERLAEYGPAARARLLPEFAHIGVDYAPKRLTLVGLKEEKRLEVWVGGASGEMRLAKSYPILAASGALGPKLRRGDRQVPEGLYGIESLNPNSRFHLALRIRYPSEDDRRFAALDGRADLGGDIMIHGGDASIGCLAMGDPAIEELFVLVADTRIENARVVLSPVDFRLRDLPPDAAATPAWMQARYEEIRRELAHLRP